MNLFNLYTRFIVENVQIKKKQLSKKKKKKKKRKAKSRKGKKKRERKKEIEPNTSKQPTLPFITKILPSSLFKNKKPFKFYHPLFLLKKKKKKKKITKKKKKKLHLF